MEGRDTYRTKIQELAELWLGVFAGVKDESLDAIFTLQRLTMLVEQSSTSLPASAFSEEMALGDILILQSRLIRGLHSHRHELAPMVRELTALIQQTPHDIYSLHWNRLKETLKELAAASPSMHLAYKAFRKRPSPVNFSTSSEYERWAEYMAGCDLDWWDIGNPEALRVALDHLGKYVAQRSQAAQDTLGRLVKQGVLPETDLFEPVYGFAKAAGDQLTALQGFIRYLQLAALEAA